MPALLLWLVKVPVGLQQLALAIPSLLKAFMEIMKALHEVEDYRERRAKAKELAAAIAEARNNKDTARLEQLLKGSEGGATDGAGIKDDGAA